MIRLDKDDVILSFWLADVPDFLCCVWHKAGEPPDHYHLACRLRHHVDGKVFESDDTKSWFRGVIHNNAATIRQRMKSVLWESKMQGWREIPINGFFDEAAMDKLTADRHIYVREFATGEEPPDAR